MEGVSESVRAVFGLLLELYEMDCKHSCDTKKSLYLTCIKRVIKQPWEAKAKYQRLCALLPYLGSDVVRINIMTLIYLLLYGHKHVLTLLHDFCNQSGAGSVW